MKPYKKPSCAAILHFALVLILTVLLSPQARADQTLLSAPSAGGSYYGMYSPYGTAASFSLAGSSYVSTIDVVVRTPSATSFTTFDFSLQSSLTSPITTFASAALTVPLGSVSTMAINVNQTLPAGTYYLVSIVPGYFGSTATAGDVDGWIISTGVYTDTAGTVTDGLWSFNGTSWSLTSGSENGYRYYAPAFSVNGSSPTPGVCGSSNLSTITSAPTSNLCTTGAPMAVTGTGPWYWTCLGADGGADASCSATPPPTVPGSPTWGGATAGNAQATVSFIAPASDGGSAIMGYTVTSNPAGGVDLNAGTTATTHTIDGLTNGKTYTFTVTATNSVGTGSPSSSSNAVKPSAKIAQNPTVKILSPKPNALEAGNSVQVNGSASSKKGIVSVWWCVNGGAWQQANGTAQWSAEVPLNPGTNTVEAYSQDPVGNVSAIASLSLVSLENLVDLYWPMNDGDTKNYDGVLGSVTMSFAATGLESFDMTVTPVDTSGDTGDMYYELDENDNLLLDGEDALGYELDFDPPLVELTALLVAKGGSVRSSSTGTILGVNISITQTVSVKNSGTVTVPVGTLTNCVTASQTITASARGRSAAASSESYVLAPNVGAIKMAALKASGASFKLLGWENLLSGTVNGVPIGDSASPEVSKAMRESEAKLANLITTDDKTLPELQVETPLVKLEFTRYDDGQSQLKLKGRSGCSYVLEAGAPDENGDLVWKSLWDGVLTNGSLSLPVSDPAAGTVYRVR